MFQVYESCFGDEVVREVREEMRAAAARCAAVSSMQPVSVGPMQAEPAKDPSSSESNLRPQRPTQTEPVRRPPASTPNLSAESMLRLQALLQGLRAVSTWP